MEERAEAIYGKTGGCEVGRNSWFAKEWTWPFRPMKITLRSGFVAVVLATMLLSSACQKKTAATNPRSESAPGRTKPLEAADLVGYDGKRLRKSVDHIKEASEKRNQQMEKMAETGPDQ